MSLWRGAQRLSASTEGTPAAGHRDHGLHRVLNAFRHQRKEHVSKTGHGLRVFDVLNAFRHQRKEHEVAQGTGPACCSCSTPFGINGRNTRFLLSVLGDYLWCSTPFGINGRNTA